MKISLEKELKKKVQEKKKELEFDPIKEVKLLLANDDAEDVKILRNLSKNSQFNRIERIQGEHMELEKIENDFHGEIYTIDQIKDLAIKYKLRFLSSQYYTGTYDVQVTAKIKDFARKTNIELTEYNLREKFSILAPEKMFSLTDEKYITKKQLDPLMFYRVDSEHYRLVHKWGDDFTILRYLTGFRWKSYWNYHFFNAALCLPIVATILTTIFGFPTDIPTVAIFVFAMLFFSNLGSYLFFGWNKSDDGDIIDSFFTPTNWNSTKKIRN
jgi:hypothetical protein